MARRIRKATTDVKKSVADIKPTDHRPANYVWMRRRVDVWIEQKNQRATTTNEYNPKLTKFNYQMQ